MEQPVTPQQGKTEPLELSPEDALVAPLTVHQIAAWYDHAWHDEPRRRCEEALEDASELVRQLSGGDEDFLRRATALRDWILDCLEDTE